MKKVFSKVQLFFITLFGNAKKLESWLLAHADEGIDILQKVKAIVDGPYLDLVKLATPDNIDHVGGRTTLNIAKASGIAGTTAIIALIACILLMYFGERRANLFTVSERYSKMSFIIFCNSGFIVVLF